MRYGTTAIRLRDGMQIAACFFAILAMAASVRAAAPADLVKAELLADVDSVKAGKPFTVGVLFHIKPEWHLYWKNPGDSGMPTRVKFHLSEGFTAGELRFPLPKRIELPGDLVNYGYEDEVMLMATITPPAEVSGSVEIGADASWLVCKDVCMPGKGSMKLTLPVTSEKPKSANQELFKKYSDLLPKAADHYTKVFLHASGPLDLSSGSGQTQIVAPVVPGEHEPIPDALPGAEITIGPGAVSGGQTRFTVKGRVLEGQHVTAKSLEVLVGAYTVNIPIVGTVDPATAPSSK